MPSHYQIKVLKQMRPEIVNNFVVTQDICHRLVAARIISSAMATIVMAERLHKSRAAIVLDLIQESEESFKEKFHDFIRVLQMSEYGWLAEMILTRVEDLKDETEKKRPSVRPKVSDSVPVMSSRYEKEDSAENKYSELTHRNPFSKGILEAEVKLHDSLATERAYNHTALHYLKEEELAIRKLLHNNIREQVDHRQNVKLLNKLNDNLKLLQSNTLRVNKSDPKVTEKRLHKMEALMKETEKLKDKRKAHEKHESHS